MKKYFALFIAVVATACMFTSCDKDDKKSGDSLAGTYWKCDMETPGDYMVLQFVDDKLGKSKYHFDDETNIASFTYSYKSPEITIDFILFDEDGEKWIYTVAGTRRDNTMILSNVDDPEDKLELEFKKL